MSEGVGSRWLAHYLLHWTTPERSAVRYRLKDDEPAEQHTYAAEWDAHRVRFYVDDTLVHTVEQGVDYLLQLMVDLFEFPAADERRPEDYPKSALVHGVRGYRPRSAVRT